MRTCRGSSRVRAGLRRRIFPSGDEKRALYELGREMLESVGYREIGMDHFALESDSFGRPRIDGALHRNFMGYTSRQVSPLIGLGVSAIGDSWTAFAQNEKLVETYQARVAERRDSDSSRASPQLGRPGSCAGMC